MDNIEKKISGPKPKAAQEDVEALKIRVEALETVLAIMAHQAGIPNSTLKDNGIQPYQLQKKDMQKYA